MPIKIDYTPVSGVGQLARYSGQQQQAVRQQQIDFTRERDVAQRNFTAARDEWLNRFSIEGMEKQWYLNERAREESFERQTEFREEAWEHEQEMFDLEKELIKEKDKFDRQSKLQQYEQKKQMDFDYQEQAWKMRDSMVKQTAWEEQLRETQQAKAEKEQKLAAIEAAGETGTLSPAEVRLLKFQTEMGRTDINTGEMEEIEAHRNKLPLGLQSLYNESVRDPQNPQKAQAYYQGEAAWKKAEFGKQEQERKRKLVAYAKSIEYPRWEPVTQQGVAMWEATPRPIRAQVYENRREFEAGGKRRSKAKDVVYARRELLERLKDPDISRAEYLSTLKDLNVAEEDLDEMLQLKKELDKTHKDLASYNKKINATFYGTKDNLKVQGKRGSNKANEYDKQVFERWTKQRQNASKKASDIEAEIEGNIPTGEQATGTLDAETAKAILAEAGGDKEKARQIAKERGYEF